MKEFFTENEQFNMQEEKFRVAFSLEDYSTAKLKADPRYIKFFVRTVGKKDGVPTQKAVPFHRCSEGDMSEFLAPEPGSVDLR